MANEIDRVKELHRSELQAREQLFQSEKQQLSRQQKVSLDQI